MNDEGAQLLRHANYVGSIQFSLEDGCLHGRVLHINDLITYEGDTLAQLQAEFKQVVNDYLEHCRTIGKKPEKPYTGSLNVRLGAERHRGLIEMSVQRKRSLNTLLCEAVDGLLADVQLDREPEGYAAFARPATTLAPTALKQAIGGMYLVAHSVTSATSPHVVFENAAAFVGTRRLLPVQTAVEAAGQSVTLSDTEVTGGEAYMLATVDRSSRNRIKH